MDFFDLPIERQIELARKVAAEALRRYDFPPTSELRLLKSGENVVFEAVHAESGEHGVLRVHRQGYQTERSIISEFQWMKALSDFGVKTPGVILSRDGALVVAVEIDDLPEALLCDMLEWIAGAPPPENDLPASFRMLGELNAKCHAQVGQWTLPPGFERQAWDEAALLDGKHPLIAPAWEHWALSAKQRALVLDCREALRERLRQWGKGPDRYGLIHSDLTPVNLIVGDNGVRLIDFDDCGFGWYLYDPASALLHYHGQDFYPDLLDAWAAGYRSVRPLSGDELEEMRSFLLLRCFYGLGWLQTHRNSEAAQIYTEPLIFLTGVVGEAFLNG